MFDGTVYFYIFIDNEFEFGCYSAFLSEKMHNRYDIKWEFDKCKVIGIDDNGDLDIALYLKSVE